MEPDPQKHEPKNLTESQTDTGRMHKKFWWLLGILVVIALFAAGALWVSQPEQETDDKTGISSRSAETPKLQTKTILSDRDHVWDMAFLPSQEMLFTERKGTISILKDGDVRKLGQVSDVYAVGEGGLLGLAVDPQFTTNRYIYLCFDSTAGDIRVARWKVQANLDGLDERTDIVTGMPRNSSGRHSGCRLAFGPDGYMWVGTGDTAQNLTPQSPQDPKSLGGKILRVDMDGKAARGNLGGAFDSRIYSYGHRNVQGLAFFGKAVRGVAGVSVEHGSTVDDEVNPLQPGNFGWAPPDGPYDESIPMTDKDRFPDAIEAIWSSGDPTQAPSGATILKGRQWKAWDGAVAIAVLKDQHLKILILDGDLKITKEERRFDHSFGRLRTATLGPDSSLYISTDNGDGQDKIVRITPE